VDFLRSKDDEKIEYADLIGVPYKLGGTGEDGYDCYGLVRELYRRIGIAIPNFTSPAEYDKKLIRQMIEQGKSEWIRQECDDFATTVLIKTPGSLHVGFCLGNGKFIHTWKASNGVCVERLHKWKSSILGYYKHERHC
jgi:cell wall-associated NlpC family hydrolase